MAPIAGGLSPKSRHPQLARLDEDGDRFYTWKDERFWSTTTMIDGGVPKYLHPHYARMAAEEALRQILARGPNSRASAISNRLTRLGRTWVAERQAEGELRSIKLDKLTGEDLALRWLKGAADRHRDAASAEGREVHDEAEALVLQHAREATRLYVAEEAIAPWPVHLAGQQRSFTKFLDEWHPEFLATEATVFNRPQAYAGTLDAIMRLRAGDLVDAILRDGPMAPALAWLADLDREDPITTLTDYKAGAIRDIVALQLASYARGEFIAGADKVTEFPMPVIQLGAVLRLGARGYRFRLVRIDDEIFNAFLYTREVYRFRKQIASTVFLADLSGPETTEEVA